MTNELKRFISFAFELILISSIVGFVILSATIGKNNLNIFLAYHDARDTLPQVVAYSKGSVGYYELVELINSYAPTTDVEITYKDENNLDKTITFSTLLDKWSVKLAVGEPPVFGEPFLGEIYGRLDGNIYKNGLMSNSAVLEMDMGLPYGTLENINGIAGNGVLDYDFIEKLFDFAKDERFICTVVQIKDSEKIAKIILEMQDIPRRT